MRLLIAAVVFALLSPLTVKAEISAAPLFAATLSTPDNQPAPLAAYKGKALVVNFWARWCSPCRAEIPELIKFRQAHRGKIEVLGIGLEDQPAAVREFASAQRINYPLFLAGTQGIPLLQALGNTAGGLPYTLYIDRNGRITGSKLGQLKAADLDAAAKELLP